MYEAKPSLYGTEIEHMLLFDPIVEQMDPDYEGNDEPDTRILDEVLDYTPRDIVHFDGFMTNGARMYVDIGDHIEYATPECTTLDDVVAHERAGEVIVLETLENMVANGLMEDGFSLHKRVKDSNGTLCGAHESYATSPELDPTYVSYFVEALAIHYITRSIFTGAGSYNRDHWEVAQKLPLLRNLSHTLAHTSDRPIVDLRDEPLAATAMSRRLHVSSGDANISPWALKMKVGTTALFIKMLENGVDVTDLILEHPVVAAHTVGTDITLTEKLSLKSGQPMTALQIQTRLAKRARKLSEVIDFTTDDKWILDEWEKACHDAAQNPLLLDGRTDWMTKMVVAQTLAKDKSSEHRQNNLSALDFMYDRIGTRPGIGITLRNRGYFAGDTTAMHLHKARRVPPTTTRAHVRGRMIFAALTNGRLDHLGELKETSWDEATFNVDEVIGMRDPWETHHHILSPLLKKALV